MRPWGAWRGVLLAASGALALASTDVSAAVCPATGDPAPDVPTLRASKTNPATEGWIVAPDCSYQVVKSGIDDHGGQYFSTMGMPTIERIESLPTGTEDLLVDTGLSRGGDFSAASKLKGIHIFSTTASVKDLVLPATLVSIQLENVPIEGIESLKLPDSLGALLIINTALKSLKNVKIPSTVFSLSLDGNKLTEVDFVLPPFLTYINLRGNPMSKLEGVVFPSTLTEFDCDDCVITSMKGVRLTDTLYFLKLGSSPITTFEIRESDVARLEKMGLNFRGTITQTSCSDPSARLVAINVGSVCVISDKRFDELYGAAPPTPAPSPTPPSGGSSSSGNNSPGAVPSPNTPTTPGSTGSGDPFRVTPPPTSSTGTRPSTGGTRPSTGGSTSTGTNDGSSSSSLGFGDSSLSQDPGKNQTGASANLRKPSTAKNGSTSSLPSGGDVESGRSVTPGAGDQVDASTTTNGTSSISKTLVTAVAIVGAAFVVLLLAVGYRTAVISRGKKDSDTMTNADTYANLETPVPSTYSGTEPRGAAGISQEYLENDIRNDALLANFRIEGSAIQIGGPIAQGGFGVIYKGVVDGEAVAIKKMLPDTWRDEAAVASFMDEIRMCVSLEHPKIVHCVGISWSSLRDLSVIIEYMNGGDLHTLLQSQSSQPITGREWSEPWTASSIKSKTSIAVDVTEAIAYLHAFSTPIIHRDLKAKNVLLDIEGNAKLSDFGISREVSMDETMTREIGTVAWIAPEVLRGERYTEQADIYSLGVLLVELDRCRHPYAHEHVLASSETDASTSRKRDSVKSGSIVKNTKIAILVSTGRLRPAPSPSCPEDVKQLIDRCLSFEANDRPTAADVQEALAQLHVDTSSTT